MDSTTPTSTSHRIGLGILLVSVSALGFAAMMAFIKHLDGRYSPMQLLFIRYGMGMILFLPIIWKAGREAWVTTKPAGHVTRAVYGLVSTLISFYVITKIPLATATTISFSMPLFLTLLSVPLLGEAVGWRRTAATLFGFTGILIIANPGGEPNPYMVLALGGAFLYAMAVTSVRKLSRTEPSIRIYVYYSMASVLIAGVTMPWLWVWPDGPDLMILLTIGVLGTVSQYWFLMAYRYAPATVIAPFDYTRLPFALGLGFFIWGELPSNWAFLGGAIIVASGFYIWWRERRLGLEGGKEGA